MKKKFMPLILAAALLLSGCHPMVEEDDHLVLYASFYPIYVLSLGITQGVMDLDMVCLTQPQDGCIRSYQLSQWDAAMLGQADALILGGQGLESFAQSLEGGSLPLISLMDGAELEGEATADEAENHWMGLNPWLFLDPSGALDMCRSLSGALQTLDPACADLYAQNLETMEAKLTQLAQEMALPGGGQVAVMHEGLIYLARAMGLTVCAQVERESAVALGDNELSEALATLADSGAQAVLLERQAPQSLVSALTQAGYRVALIDTLTAHDEADPEIYFEAMAANAQAVASALNPD